MHNYVTTHIKNYSLFLFVPDVLLEKKLFFSVAVGMDLHRLSLKSLDSENTGNDVVLRIGFSQTPKGFLLLTNQIMDQCIPVGSHPDFL